MLAVESDISVISATVLMSSNSLIIFKPQTTCWAFLGQNDSLRCSGECYPWIFVWVNDDTWVTFRAILLGNFFEQYSLGTFLMGNKLLFWISGYFRLVMGPLSHLVASVDGNIAQSCPVYHQAESLFLF